MIDDLATDEAEELLAKIKFGDPGIGWDWAQELAGVTNCAFGVTDADGLGIRGVTADLLVKYGVRPPSVHFRFTIFKLEYKTKRRAYQLDILQNGRKRLDPHRAPHEHIGRRKQSGDPCWLSYTYDDALKLFCSRTNLSLASELSDPYSLTLT
ncbi:hypothetical protein GCM10027093_12900 [Paraburkholderia jirisanensis]